VVFYNQKGFLLTRIFEIGSIDCLKRWKQANVKESCTNVVFTGLRLSKAES